MDTTSDIDKRTLTITRTFNAPRNLVWDAWSQPDHLGHWWGRGMPVEIEKHDFAEGGEWRYTMNMPDGNQFITHGVYSRIDSPERIESTANFIPMTEGVEYVATFHDAGDHTDFEFKVIHPTEEYCRQQEEMGFYNGWGSIFEVLDGYLAQQDS